MTSPRPEELHLAVQAAAKLRDRLSRDPVLARYSTWAAAIRGRTNQVHTEPWQALGEFKVAALVMCGYVLGLDGVRLRYGNRLVVGDENNEYRQRMLGAVMRAQSSAAVYAWSDEMRDIAHAAPLPKHVTSREMMPNPSMFFSYAMAYGLLDGMTGEDLGLSNWIYLEREARGISVLTDIETPDGLVLALGFIPFGQVYPTDFPGYEEAAGRILKLLAFLNSPYVSSTASRLPRPIRRDAVRLGLSSLVESTVNVVTLRRPSTKAAALGDSPATEFHHQWWVSGHYRAQWHPSEQAHHVRWIAPYIKGPADKPFLEKVYAVVR